MPPHQSVGHGFIPRPGWHSHPLRQPSETGAPKRCCLPTSQKPAGLLSCLSLCDHVPISVAWSPSSLPSPEPACLTQHPHTLWLLPLRAMAYRVENNNPEKMRQSPHSSLAFLNVNTRLVKSIPKSWPSKIPAGMGRPVRLSLCPASLGALGEGGGTGVSSLFSLDPLREGVVPVLTLQGRLGVGPAGVASALQGPVCGCGQGWGQYKDRLALTRESCAVSSPSAARTAGQTTGPGAHRPGREEREADLDPRGR